MCGRTALHLDKENIRCACAYKSKSTNLFLKPKWSHEHNDGKQYVPSYNIAPTDVTPVLISNTKDTEETDRILKPMIWGIIPPWHKGDYQKHNLSTNNCRLENIKSSKLYNPILQNGGRCVIIVEGFYEWQTTDKTSKVKQPYYIYALQEDDIKIDEPETWNNSFTEVDGWKGVRLLHFAGLYSVWQKEDKIIYSYSVITMESNDTLSWLHHRMPAILDTQEQIEVWLDVDNVDSDMALSYLKPIKALSWYKVSTFVNNSRNKSVECNKRLSTDQQRQSSQTTITSWFTKSKKRQSNEETESESKKIKK